MFDAALRASVFPAPFHHPLPMPNPHHLPHDPPTFQNPPKSFWRSPPDSVISRPSRFAFPHAFPPHVRPQPAPAGRRSLRAGHARLRHRPERVSAAPVRPAPLRPLPSHARRQTATLLYATAICPVADPKGGAARDSEVSTLPLDCPLSANASMRSIVMVKPDCSSGANDKSRRPSSAIW